MMKRIKLLAGLTALALSIGLCSLARADTTVRLTLEDCVEWALREGESVIQARLQSLIAREETEIAQSRYDGRFQAFAQYEDSSLPMRGNPLIRGSESTVVEAGIFRTLSRGTEVGLGMDVGRFRYASSPEFQLPSDMTMATTRISVTQPLWRNAWGALDRAQTRAAQSRFAASELYLDDARQAIAGLVHALFWQVYTAEADAEANVRSLEWAIALAEISERRHADRLIDEPDLLSAQAAATVRKAELLRDRLRADQVRMQLFEVIGWPVEQWDSTRLIFPQPTQSFVDVSLEQDTTALLSEALLQRADYQALTFERSAWQEDAEMARQAGRPGVDLQAYYGVGDAGATSRDAWSAEESAWAVGLSVDVAWGQRAERARRAQARLNEELVEARREQMARQIYRELMEALRSYQAAHARKQAIQQAVELYRRRLALEEDLLAQGRSTTEQVIRFRDELERAEHQQIVTRADLEMARAAFALARGVLLADGGRSP